MGNEVTSLKNHCLNFKGSDFAQYDFQDETAISMLVTTLMATISPPIKCITIQQCKMDKLPPLSIIEQSFGFSDIRSCYICENQINELPNDFDKLITLKELSLSSNKFTKFDVNLFTLEKLQRLSIDRNEICDVFPPKVPNNIFCGIYKTLSALDASFNKISSISPEISKFEVLEQLNLSHNELSTFPLGVLELKKLRILDLSNNNIQNIPPQISKLQSIIILKLHCNQIGSIPQELKNLPVISELILYSNKFDVQKYSEILKEIPGSVILDDNSVNEPESAPSRVQKVKQLLQSSKPRSQQPQSKAVPPRESIRPIGEFEMAFKSVLASFDDNDKIKLQMKKLSLEEKWLLLQTRGKNRKQGSSNQTRSVTPRKSRNNSNNNNDEEDENAEQQKMIDNHIKQQQKEEMDDLEEEEQLSEQITQIIAKSEEAPTIKDGKYFISQLQGDISLQDLSLLYDELSNNGNEYIEEFDGLGGSELILGKLKDFINLEESFSEPEEFTQLELLKCYNIIFQLKSAEIIHNIAGKKVNNNNNSNISLEDEDNALRIVAANGGWKKGQSSDQSVNLQILSLQILLSASNVDHPSAVRLVIDAFDYVKNSVQTNEGRFQHLLLALSEDKSIDESLRVSLQSTALSLINGIIDGTDELKNRCSLRKELFNLNLEAKLGELKGLQGGDTKIKEVLGLFLESMDDDFEEVLERDGIEEVLKLRPVLAPRPQDHLLVLPLVTGSASACPIVVPFSPDETLSKITKSILQSITTSFEGASSINFEECGLYFPKCAAYEGFWGDENDTFSKLNLSGEVIAEFKYKYWTINLVYYDEDDNEKTQTIPNIDPNLIIGDALQKFIEQIYSKDKLVDIEDYCLFIKKGGFLKLSNSNEEGEILILSQRFINYKTNPKVLEKRIYLKEKPISVNANLSEGIHEVIQVDPSLYAKELFTSLVSKVNIPPLNICQYQLYIERPLDEDKGQLPVTNNVTPNNYAVRGMGVGGHRAPENIKRYSMIFSPLYRIPVEHNDKLRKYKLTHRDTIVIALTPAEAKIRAARRTVYVKIEENASPRNGKRYSIYAKQMAREAVSLADGDSERKRLLTNIENAFVDLKFPNVIDIQNIWDEPVDGNIEFNKDGKVRAATLNQLVSLLTDHRGDFDRVFADTFFTTCPTFCTPTQFLAKVTERYEPAPNLCDKETLKLIRMRVLLAIGTWIDHKPTFFINNPVINSFFELCKYDEFSPMVTSMNQKALLAANVKNPLLSLPKNIMPKKISFLDIDPLEIAKQICIKTFPPFIEIKSEELVGQAWSKSDGKERAPNVIKSIDLFNYFSHWVSGTILAQEKVRNRAKIFTKMIDIAMKLLSLNNFQLVMAFISGFNVCAVSRLKWTQAKLSKQSKKSLQRLEQIMSMEGSFRNYRELINKSEPPGIPYLGVYLQDITFIEDGNLDYVVAHMINFEKRWMLFDVISKIRRFQKEYRFKPIPFIQQLFDVVPYPNDDELYKVSMQREPRNATRSEID